MKKVHRWEIVGIFIIVGFGASLHIWFEWTDYWRPMALIAAVNESTWEHFKIAFWPSLIYALIEYPFIKNETNNFFVANHQFLGHAGDHRHLVLRLHQPDRYSYNVG